MGVATMAYWAQTGLRPSLGIDREAARAQLQAVLGEEAFTAAWAAGQTLTLEDAVTEALEGGGHLDPLA
jgi:hypothetical protein